MKRAFACLLLCASASAQTQDRRPQTADRRPLSAASLQVYLVTIGQGNEYWEKYGHNMLVFRDTVARLDLAYNWGSFDFNAPDFLARQLVGDPQYWVDTLPTGLVIDFYRNRDRTIVVQRLNFTPEHAAKALALARENIKPANKFYRYDYYRDNCSTRIRDIIDAVVGGALKRATSGKATALTYRSETVRLLDDMKFTQLGVTVALGRPADRPLSEWEAGFIPMRLRDAVRDMRFATPSGAPAPLVAEERVLFRSAKYNDLAEAPSLRLPYLLVGLVVGVVLVATGMVGQRRRGLEVAFRAEATAWALVTGLLGLVLLLGWTITQHVFWYRNENLLLFNPLSLFLSVLLALSLRNARWLRPAAICAVIVALLAAVGLIVKGIPGGSQDNLALIGLTLPVHFAIAFNLWWRSRQASV